MKVSAYYAIFFRRQNLLKQAFLGFFFGLCSWPRLIMEVFLRRKMGERYFSLMSVLVVFGVLTNIPNVARYARSSQGFFLWYVFAVIFLGMGVYRKWQLWRHPHSFSFKRFSLSTGKSWPQLQSVTYKGQSYVFSSFVVQTLVEPAVFFLPGVLLWLVGQKLGYLFMVCAVFYSLSYVASFQQGRDFLLDRIDQRICESDLGETMIQGAAPDFSRGVDFPGELPTDPEHRQQLALAFLNAEDIAYPIH